MSKNICVLVPTYPPHYLHAMGLMESFYKLNFDDQADIYFVFTTPEEAGGFVPSNKLILPSKLNIKKNNGLINIKKFYGLMQLKHQYEYLLVLDDDCRFTQKADLQKVCDTFFSEKILYGSMVEGNNAQVIGIVKQAQIQGRTYFRKHPHKQVIYTSLSLWFNQPCIYRTDTLSEFFQCTKLDRCLAKLTYFDFDYNIYMNYLILYQEFQILSCGLACEVSAAEATEDTYFKCYTDEYKKLHFWAATAFAQRLLKDKSTFITWHVDRDLSAKSTLPLLKKMKHALQCYLGVKTKLL